MTDTPASLDALEPMAWMYSRQKAFIGILRQFPDPHLRDDGYTETALVSADDLAPLIAKARRVEALEAALRKIAAECCVPVGADKQMYARWRRLAADRVDIARAALKENTDATSD